LFNPIAPASQERARMVRYEPGATCPQFRCFPLNVHPAKVHCISYDRSLGGDPWFLRQPGKAAVMFSSARSLLALTAVTALAVIGVPPASASPAPATAGH
jgi:hypothetical protein